MSVSNSGLTDPLPVRHCFPHTQGTAGSRGKESKFPVHSCHLDFTIGHAGGQGNGASAVFQKQSGHSILHAQKCLRRPSVSKPRIPVYTWVPLGTHTHTPPQDPCVHMVTVGNTHIHSSECSDSVHLETKEEGARSGADELGTKHACGFLYHHLA